jgi:DNA-binding transcriptional MerR regulator
MFSIGEFARLGGVSIRTLRHYDEIGLLRPAQVDPATGYRAYTAQQLSTLNRVMALKELGLSLIQVRRLLDGVTVDELRGMLMLRRAQLEDELEEHTSQLLGVEARLRHIEKEAAMPADDIVAKKIPAMGVVVVSGVVSEFDTPPIVAMVNHLERQFGELRIRERVKAAGPVLIYYERGDGDGATVNLALPVAEPPAGLPEPAHYRVLPEVEVAAAVRSGPAASIYPMVLQDLVRWIDDHGYQAVPDPRRDVWLHEIDDVADVALQTFEVQMQFIRPAAGAADAG